MAEETGNTEPEELPPNPDNEVEADGTVVGELVEGELVDGELLVPDDWGDLSRDVEEALDPDADGLEERRVEGTEGALPSDLDIEFLGGDDGSELESEDEVEGPSFDFGERFEPDDADLLDGLVFDEDSIGVSRRAPEPDSEGALPDDLPIEFEDAVEPVGQESAGDGADSLDLWSVSLDGGWVADLQPEPAMGEGVRAALAAHGVVRHEHAVPLAPLYGGTESFEAKLGEGARVVDESDSPEPGDAVEETSGGALSVPNAAQPEPGANTPEIVQTVGSEYEIETPEDLFRAAAATRDVDAPVVVVTAEQEGSGLTPPDAPIEDIRHLDDALAGSIIELEAEDILIDIELEDADIADVTHVFEEVDGHTVDHGVTVGSAESAYRSRVTNPLVGPFELAVGVSQLRI